MNVLTLRHCKLLSVGMSWEDSPSFDMAKHCRGTRPGAPINVPVWSYAWAAVLAQLKAALCHVPTSQIRGRVKRLGGWERQGGIGNEMHFPRSEASTDGFSRDK